MTGNLPHYSVIEIQKLSEDSDLHRLWIENTDMFYECGFQPDHPLTVTWVDDCNFVCHPSKESDVTNRINDQPSRLFLDLLIPKHIHSEAGQYFRITWNMARIKGQLMTPIPNGGAFLSEWNHLLNLVDHTKSSNSKYRQIHDRESHSPRSMIAGLMGLNDEDVYIVAPSKIHNIRKNLLQTTQTQHKVGIGLFFGDIWDPQLVERYCSEYAISDNFEDGIIIFCSENGMVKPVGLSLMDDAFIFDRIIELNPSMYIHSHDRISSGRNSSPKMLDSSLIAATRLLPEVCDLPSMNESEIAQRLHNLAEAIRNTEPE